MSDSHRRPGRGPGWLRRGRGRQADPHTLLGAYAMDAVTGDDGARFEQHLADCEACQAELIGLREAAARLGGAAEVRPRAELREQTVRAAGRISQLPPVTAASPAGPVASWRRALTPRALTPRAVTRRARGPRGWLPRLAVGSALAFALVAAGFGYAMQGAEQRLDVVQSSSHAIAAVLSAPDARMMTTRVMTGGSATVVMSHRDGALVFTAADLRQLPRARAYELWLMTPAGSRSVAVLPAARNGMTGPLVVSGLAPGDEVGLTVEPAGGSPHPTSVPIMMFLL